jgi:hypothetical protein
MAGLRQLARQPPAERITGWCPYNVGSSFQGAQTPLFSGIFAGEDYLSHDTGTLPDYRYAAGNEGIWCGWGRRCDVKLGRRSR